ncbi:MAG: ribonuclease E/G [Firmicutes bacterium]|nr:ribonuclease E/G [Bacillota bacterium]
MYQLIVSQSFEKVQAGVLYNDTLMEYYEFSENDREILGDIRLGQVREVVPGINAVFMNVGENRPGFMPVDKGRISDYKPGQEFLVQIQKAAIGEKGVVVTDHLSLTGQYVVLTPDNPKLGVSSKITEETERQRLREIGKTFPEAEEIGYILRTESQGQREAVLRREAEKLYELFGKLQSRAKYSRIGETLYSAGTGLGKLILGFPVDQIEKIVIDDAYLMTRLQEELMIQRPALEGKFQLYQDAKWPVMDLYKISSQLQKAMQKRVMLQDGGYLFIEETEALAVIDVNTGKSIRGQLKEEAITAFNLKTVPLIVQQILLRNLAGIIVIDFIDMKKNEHQKQVLDALTEEFKKDRRKTQIFGFTRLELVEISRERKGLPLSKI